MSANLLLSPILSIGTPSSVPNTYLALWKQSKAILPPHLTLFHSCILPILIHTPALWLIATGGFQLIHGSSGRHKLRFEQIIYNLIFAPGRAPGRAFGLSSSLFELGLVLLVPWLQGFSGIIFPQWGPPSKPHCIQGWRWAFILYKNSTYVLFEPFIKWHQGRGCFPTHIPPSSELLSWHLWVWWFVQCSVHSSH